MDYIHRTISESIEKATPFFRVIAVVGARQVGKTTLCKQLFPNYGYVNLESIPTRELIAHDMQRFIDQVDEGIIIDEAHHLPELFSYIQVATDAHPHKRFVLTGSSNFAMLQQITQSLAGRVALFTLPPLAMSEVATQISSLSTDELLFRGLYPAAFVADMHISQLYSNYYTTYIERDVHQLIRVKDLSVFQQFMRLCAGRVGSECNYAALANATGMSAPTIKEWISILEASYILFTLQPYYENISKRLVKTPKIYFYDTGVLCLLLGIENPTQLATHPLRGAIFENLVITEFLKNRMNHGKLSNLYFYRESRGTEIDMVQVDGNQLSLYEIKSSSTFSSRFFDNIKSVSKTYADRILRSGVIYDGRNEVNSTIEGVFNYRSIPFDSINE